MRLTNEVARKNEEEETSKDLPDCDFGIGDVPHIHDDEMGGGRKQCCRWDFPSLISGGARES